MKIVIMILFLGGMDISARTIFLFAHGLWRNKRQVKEFVHNYERDAFMVNQSQWDIAPGPYYTFDFPDATKQGQLDSKKVNIGQDDDINRLHEACQNIIHHEQQQGHSASLVIIGCSRGAMTAISAAGTLHFPYIKGIVAEAPGHCVYSVLNHWLSCYKINWGWLVDAVYYLMYSYVYPQHKKEGVHPCTAAHTIPKTMPILLVHSKNDEITPIQSSRLLYVTLRLKGNNDVYLLELENAVHGRYYQCEEASKYQAIVHAFYNRYDIPCDIHQAEAGKELLSECQPSLHKVLERIFIEQFANTLKKPFVPSPGDNNYATIHELFDLIHDKVKHCALHPSIVGKICHMNPPHNRLSHL